MPNTPLDHPSSPTILALGSWGGRLRLILQFLAVVLGVVAARLMFDPPAQGALAAVRRVVDGFPIILVVVMGGLALMWLVVEVGGRLVLRFDRKARARTELMRAEIDRRKAGR